MRRPLWLLVAVTAVLVYNVSGVPWQPEFVYAPLNYWLAAALALSVPALVLWIALNSSRRFLRLGGVVASAIIAIPCFFLAALSWLDGKNVENNVDRSFELLSEGQTRLAHYRLYRTNCGATCAYGLMLRKEYDVVPGVKLVTPIWSQYRASEGEIVLEGTSTVHVVNGSTVLVTIQE